MFHVHCSSKTLDDYPACRIIGKFYKVYEIHRNNSINHSDYTNALSNDIQNAIEETIEDPEVQNIIKLAKNIESITTQRADEVKTVTQLLSQSNKTESFRTTGNVDFK